MSTGKDGEYGILMVSLPILKGVAEHSCSHSPYSHAGSVESVEREDLMHTNDLTNMLNEFLEKKKGDFRIVPLFVPMLKIGTLDSLISISDTMVGIELMVDGFFAKTISNLKNILGYYEKIDENSGNDLRKEFQMFLIDGVSPFEYARNWRWDDLKYQDDVHIKQISDLIADETNTFDTTIKEQMDRFSDVKMRYANFKKKKDEPLAFKTITKNHINRWNEEEGRNLQDEIDISKSEILEKIYVVVPIDGVREWYDTYETLTDNVVPRSCEEIKRDDESILFSIVIFKKYIPEFTSKAKRGKFIVKTVRDDGSEEYLDEDFEKLKYELYDWVYRLLEYIQGCFSETFKNILHIRTLRLLVENVLNFGLPMSYWNMMIVPSGRDKKKKFRLDHEHTLEVLWKSVLCSLPQYRELEERAVVGKGDWQAYSGSSKKGSQVDVFSAIESFQNKDNFLTSINNKWLMFPFVVVDVKWTL